MTMATKKQTVNFNKFFPDEDSYVTLRGAFNPLSPHPWEEFDLDLTIQTAQGRSANIYAWLGDSAGTLKQLKAINEATAKAIKFLEDAMATKKTAKKSKPIIVEPRVTKQRK